MAGVQGGEKGGHLLIMSLHAEEDEVGCGTGQAALQVRAASNLLSLCIKAVQGLDCLLKELPLDLWVEKDRSGWGQPPSQVHSGRWQWG